MKQIVLVHGIWDTQKVFRRIALALTEAGWTVHLIDIKPNDGRIGIAKQAVQLDLFIADNIPDGNFSLLGFSMGGMVCRHYAQQIADKDRIQHLITLGSPHNGTRMAYAGIHEAYLDFQPNSSFLKELRANEASLANIKRLSIYTPLDTMIVPAKNSIVEGWENVALPVINHPMLLKDHRVIEKVVEFLS